jgi:hypothetical protein
MTFRLPVMEWGKEVLMMMVGMIFAGFADHRCRRGYHAAATVMDYQGDGFTFRQRPLRIE